MTDRPAVPIPDPEAFTRAAAGVAPLDRGAMEAARDRWAGRAKPPGSLGRLEDLAAHLAAVTGRCPPAVPVRPAVAVFAGDHGVAADGVTAWPQEVTALMVAGMAAGGAAVNAFAHTIGATVDRRRRGRGRRPERRSPGSATTRSARGRPAWRADPP